MKCLWIILPFLFLASCWGGSEQSVQTKRSEKVVSLNMEDLPADTVRLGRMNAGEVIRQELSLRNDTGEPFVILDVSTTCGCTSVEYPRHTIEPGSEVPFSFEFDSRRMSGYQSKRLTVKTSQKNVTHRIIVTAEVNK